MKKKVAIIKYSKAGNIGSLKNAILKIINKKFDVLITNNPSQIKSADVLVLPGVGNFQETMEDLTNKKITQSIIEHHRNKKYLLGICVGMQILFEHSEEGNFFGLGLIKGTVKKIRSNMKLPIPIIGWRKNFYFYKKNNKDMENYFYFLHSYEVKVNENRIKKMYYLNNRTKTISVIKKNNILASQFHPELSSDSGLNFLDYFFNSFVK